MGRREITNFASLLVALLVLTTGLVAQQKGVDTQTQKIKTEGLLRASRQALSADNPQLAESLAREGLAQAPQDHHAMELLVLALMDQDRGQEALPWARKIASPRFAAR